MKLSFMSSLSAHIGLAALEDLADRVSEKGSRKFEKQVAKVCDGMSRMDAEMRNTILFSFFGKRGLEGAKKLGQAIGNEKEVVEDFERYLVVKQKYGSQK